MCASQLLGALLFPAPQTYRPLRVNPAYKILISKSSSKLAIPVKAPAILGRNRYA